MRKSIFAFLLLAGIACSPKSTQEENYLSEISDPDVMKYAIHGKTLYENYCANCHQADGKGLGKLIPPLKDADYFRASIPRAVWIMKNGQKGEIMVNGQVYDQPMPANPNLKPLDIAQISTYLYNIWGMNEGVITSAEVEKYLQEAPENY
ncbi:c-type cytochrome [Algoriphagus formosus]|uniref:c-type cytochrome n=1 Tax=Algoriphagus formosus TaxID=2007308 RepID=UPI000C2912D6|nr:cytochrome c [Algoriphagus formosus]